MSRRRHDGRLVRLTAARAARRAWLRETRRRAARQPRWAWRSPFVDLRYWGTAG